MNCTQANDYVKECIRALVKLDLETTTQEEYTKRIKDLVAAVKQRTVLYNPREYCCRCYNKLPEDEYHICSNCEKAIFLENQDSEESKTDIRYSGCL